MIHAIRVRFADEEFDNEPTRFFYAVPDGGRWRVLGADRWRYDRDELLFVDAAGRQRS